MILIAPPLWMIVGCFIFLLIKVCSQIREEKEEEERFDRWINKVIDTQKD